MILEAKNLMYSYKSKKDTMVLKNMSASFEERTFYSIVGSSGSGKTTFLSLLAGLDQPTSGKIKYNGEDIQKKGLNYHRRHHISLVFQNYNLIDYLTTEENVKLGGSSDAGQLLQEVSIPKEDWKRNVLQLSGGQQQRVAIARALVNKPAILLCDEPTGNLDSATTIEVMGLLKSSSRKYKQTILMVTHNEAIAQTCDRVIHIEDGQILTGKRLFQAKGGEQS